MPRESASDLQGLSVLVVEDGWQVADALRISLEKLGMVVVGPVASVREAKDLATQRCPAFAIVDVNLRGEMAYQLMDWLHERGVQVVVISGYEDLPPSLDRFAAILHKPFTAAMLRTTLQDVAARKPPG